MSGDTLPAVVRRPELHERARAAIARILAHVAHGASLPDDAREILGYYASTELAFDRAAEHVLAYSSRLGGAP